MPFQGCLPFFRRYAKDRLDRSPDLAALVHDYICYVFDQLRIVWRDVGLSALTKIVPFVLLDHKDECCVKGTHKSFYERQLLHRLLREVY